MTEGNEKDATTPPPALTDLTPERVGQAIEDALTPREWAHAWQRIFIASFAKSLNVAASCRLAGVSRQTAYAYRSADAEFAAAWLEAKEVAIEFREAVADRWATVGEPRTETTTTVRREIVDGKLVIVEEVTRTTTSVDKSPRLLEFLLRAHRPEKYRERLDLRRVPDGERPEPEQDGVWREPTHDRMLELADLARELEVPRVVEGTGRLVESQNGGNGAVGTDGGAEPER